MKRRFRMIQNQWYGILETREIKGSKPVGVTRLGEKLVLWRNTDGTLNCISDQCCHRGAALHAGEIIHDTVRCPFHGFAYDASGKVVLIPANGSSVPVADRYRVRAFKVREQYGFVWLWNGDYSGEQPEVPFFPYLRQGFTYGGFSETWPVHYTRAIENQLDVVHLPFVHGNSIGRGNKTVVNGPVVTWEDNLMTFYVNNVLDDGTTKPLKPEEIPDFEDLFSLQFQMPNMWQNRISKDIRIVAVFAPIDESNTRIYLRFYQRFMKAPILRQMVNGLSNISNKYILHQDRRVVLTQIPKKTELKMGENLIQGDAPIIEYRKRRALLKGE